MANERMKELENMNSRVYITRKVKKKKEINLWNIETEN